MALCRTHISPTVERKHSWENQVAMRHTELALLSRDHCLLGTLNGPKRTLRHREVVITTIILGRDKMGVLIVLTAFPYHRSPGGVFRKRPLWDPPSSISFF
jgi:hypothetical protein